MAKYSTFKYGTGVRYGVQTTLYWVIQIDWQDSNFAEGYNEDDRCVGLEWERGRDTFLESNTNGIRFPSVGRATLTLDNHDGLYNSRNTASPYYGYIAPGHQARIGIVTPNSPLSTQWRFTGRVADIRPTGWRNGYVDIVIEDALQWLYDQDIDIDVQQSIRIDEAIDQVLTTAAWPWPSDLSISSDSIPYWWASKKASSEIADLTASGIGYFSVLGDGTARFINRNEISPTIVNLTDDNTLNDPKISQPWENYKNIIRVRWFPKQLQSSAVIWSDTTLPLLLAPSATYVTFGDYTSNNQNVPALFAAVGASDYSANSASDGSGTDLTANFSVVLTDFGTSAKLVVTNNGAVQGYLTLLQITGQAITNTFTGSFIDNRLDYATNPRTWALDLNWQQNSARAESIASILADYLSAERLWPVVQVENRFDVQFTPDIFDTVRYASAFLMIDESFRVGKIREKWLSENGQSIRTTFILEPYVPGVNAWTWPITDFGTDTIFG
jgi:hypothetical protein